MTDDNNGSKEQGSSSSDETLLNGIPAGDYTKVQPQTPEKPQADALEVKVDHSIEKAIKVLKRKLIKEGLFKELKSRRFYEKPSERNKRKLKESLKKIRKDEARRKKNQVIF